MSPDTPKEKHYQCETIKEHLEKCKHCYYYGQPCLSEIRCPEGYAPTIRVWEE